MDATAKQQIAEKIRSSNSVLVTVSDSPTVDQLAAALGLTLMLNELNKHTTAVFSGDMPNTMEFLEPGKTFENTVEGLRDFIISLDKEKADKLRYKVEDDIVKIFITPYRDAITDKDLRYSQGDYNVDLVVALGVHNRDQLDNAITSHGRILHDATIVTVNAGDGAADGSLGSINWGDPAASCLCEMLVSISEALQGGIIDAQMSTAFLTGIVAATERFKNDNTTPKIMTMAAQLMAAGANQQLIATNLQLTEEQVKKQEAKEEANKIEEIKNEADEFGGKDNGWKLGGEKSTASQPELGSTNEDSLDPELLAKIKEINRIHAQSALAPATMGKRKRESGKRESNLNGPDPSVEEDSFNASSADVKREKARKRSNEKKQSDNQQDSRPKKDNNPDSKPGNSSSPSDDGTSDTQPPEPAVELPAPPPAPKASPPPAAPPREEKPTPPAPEPAPVVDHADSSVAAPDDPVLQARQAVESAVTTQFETEHNPIESLNAQPMSDHGDMSADIQGSAAPIIDQAPLMPEVPHHDKPPVPEGNTFAIPPPPSAPVQAQVPQAPVSAAPPAPSGPPSAPPPPPPASAPQAPPPPPLQNS